MKFKKWNKLSEKVLFKNKFWSYHLDHFEIEGKSSGEYHYVHTLGSTMIIPKTEKGNLLLVNQFRYLNKKESLEFPCGSLEVGLTLAENAIKELREESGMDGDLNFIGEFSPYTGVSDEMCSVFTATNLFKSPLPPDPTEEFEIVELSINNFEELIEQNIIWDGLTLSAWALAKKHLIG